MLRELAELVPKPSRSNTTDYIRSQQFVITSRYLFHCHKKYIIQNLVEYLIIFLIIVCLPKPEFPQ